MRVYIPFDDGSSVAFDGDTFTIQKRPKDINDAGEDEKPCKAETAWSARWSAIVRALETAYKRQEKARKAQSAKRIYRP